jgi:hypothetical protein
MAEDEGEGEYEEERREEGWEGGLTPEEVERLRKALREGRRLTPKEVESLKKALKKGELTPEEFKEAVGKIVQELPEVPREELPEKWAALRQLLTAYAEARWGTRGLTVAKELLVSAPRYYRGRLRSAVREVGRGARLERVVAGMPRVIAYASLAIAVGALAAFIEGFLWRTGTLLALLLAIALTLPYTFIYVFFIVVLHGLAATVLLSITKVVRGYAYRRTAVDMFFWTVFSAAVAASCRAAWLPFFLGLAAWPLLAIAFALAPVQFIAAVVVLVALLLLFGFLAQAAGAEWGVWSFLARALLVVLGAPFLLVAGVPTALFSVAKMVDAAWDISDVPLAFLIALFSLVQWLAPPLAATVLAGVWLFFGTIAAATREWGWLRIPIAALVVYSANLLGYNYDLAASAAVEIAWWLGEETGSVGVRLAALVYAYALHLEGVKLVPLMGAQAPPQEAAWPLLQEAVRDLLRGAPPSLP